jgi:hypothetical protein
MIQNYPGNTGGVIDCIPWLPIRVLGGGPNTLGNHPLKQHHCAHAPHACQAWMVMDAIHATLVPNISMARVFLCATWDCRAAPRRFCHDAEHNRSKGRFHGISLAPPTPPLTQQDLRHAVSCSEHKDFRVCHHLVMWSTTVHKPAPLHYSMHVSGGHIAAKIPGGRNTHNVAVQKSSLWGDVWVWVQISDQSCPALEGLQIQRVPQTPDGRVEIM